MCDKTPNFDYLRHEIRIKEEEVSQRKKSNINERTQAISSSDDFAEIKAMIQNWSKDVAEMRKRVYSADKNENRENHTKYGNTNYTSYRRNTKGRGQGYRQKLSQGRESTEEMKCQRCGQSIHLQYGCKVRLDHKRD